MVWNDRNRRVASRGEGHCYYCLLYMLLCKEEMLLCIGKIKSKHIKSIVFTQISNYKICKKVSKLKISKKKKQFLKSWNKFHEKKIGTTYQIYGSVESLTNKQLEYPWRVACCAECRLSSAGLADLLTLHVISWLLVDPLTYLWSNLLIVGSLRLTICTMYNVTAYSHWLGT